MTTTKTFSIRQALDEANPSLFNQAMIQAKFGKTQKKIKATITALTAIAAPVINNLIGASLSIVINQGPDDIVSSGVLPPIGQLVALRVTASGTATSVGSYIASDSGGTPTLPTGGASAGVGIATLSDDGTTITFPNTVTAFVIEYYCAPLVTVGSNGQWVAGDVNAELGQPAGGIGDE